MADIQKLYDLWLAKAVADPDLKKELESIKDDEDGKNDRFYRDLEFGTGGLRGVIGAGTNRMNVYTVKKATQGLAEYILASGEKKSVAISCDSRIKSDYFSKSAAEVLAANGIKVHIYKELMPTPHAVLGSKSTGLRRRRNGNSKPQPCQVQRLQGIRKRRLPAHT